MVKVAVSGAAGRMGKRLVSLAASDPELKLVGALEAPGHPDMGKDAGLVAGIGEIGVKIIRKLPAGADALIDFSAPEATLDRLEEALKMGLAAVIGTTGLSEEGVSRIEAAAGRIAIVFSPNMSVGVNLLFKIAPRVAEALGGGYDVEIVETHHRRKADAPSGTALALARGIAEVLGRNLEKTGVYGRRGKMAGRSAEEIGIHAVRVGDVVGEHVVIFGNTGERIELVHRANTRDAFASGALRAAKFVAGKPPGLYGMADVLGIE